MDSSKPPQYPFAHAPPAMYSYSPISAEGSMVPTPGSKMAKYKTSLCKHYEQTGTCQMEHRCHFAHGKEELRKQTDPLPMNITDLYQTPVSTTAPPGYVHNKYKTVPCKNFQLGFCKYGDRCTFAHGDVDMRAKFVPASTLYPSTNPDGSQDAQMQQSISQQDFQQNNDYYSVFQPNDSFNAFGAVENNMSGPGMSFHGYEQHEMYQPSSSGTQNLMAGPSYYPQNNSVSMSGGFGHEQFLSQDPSNGMSGFAQPKETSKFGFGYDSLVDNIDELELTDPSDANDQNLFQTAKEYIQEGKNSEANQILEGLMENKKLQYKQLSYFGNNIFMNSFAPISDFN